MRTVHRLCSQFNYIRDFLFTEYSFSFKLLHLYIGELFL